MRLSVVLSVLALAGAAQAATVEISVPKKAFVKDLSALGCAPGFGYNDALHTLSTGRADVFYSERTNETAAAFRGIVIAGMIGIEKMRSQCPNFDE